MSSSSSNAAAALLDIDRAESAFALLFRFGIDEAYGSDEEDFQAVLSELLRGLRLPPGAKEKLERIYRSVRNDPKPLEVTLRQVVSDFSSVRGVFMALMSLLLRLTAVDGMLSRRHSSELLTVFDAFDFSPLELELFTADEQILLSYIRFGTTPSSGWTGSVEARELARHYDTLGCRPDVSDAELRQVYRTLAKKFHPDSHQQDEKKAKKTAERFRAIQTAYEAVSKAREK